MKVLVIGAAGGFGGAVARELVRRGADVRALARPGGHRPRVPGATVVEADALDADRLRAVAAGVDVLVFGFHVPYPKWDPVAIRAARVTADVAAALGATVLFPGNVYNLGPDFSVPVTEDAPRVARTELGRIRNRIEAVFEDAARKGARVIVLRAGDYYGEGSAHSWFELLTTRAIRGGRILVPAPAAVPHAWAYLPDLAQAAVDLLERRAALARFEIVHFGGHAADSTAFVDTVRAALGDAARKTLGFPWWLVGIAALFSPLLRYARSMRYLWQEPVLLDDRKLRRLLPDFAPTPFGQAVTRAVAEARSRSSSSPMRIRTNAASARSS